MNKTTEYEEEFDNDESVRVRVQHDPSEMHPIKVQFVDEYGEVQYTEEFNLGALNVFLKLLNTAKRTLKEG